MGNEATKTREIWTDDVKSLFKGSGLDIGAGEDLIHPSAKPFDKAQGDANRIDEFLSEQLITCFLRTASNICTIQQMPFCVGGDW